MNKRSENMIIMEEKSEEWSLNGSMANLWLRDHDMSVDRKKFRSTQGEWIEDILDNSGHSAINTNSHILNNSAAKYWTGALKRDPNTGKSLIIEPEKRSKSVANSMQFTEVPSTLNNKNILSDAISFEEVK